MDPSVPVTLQHLLALTERNLAGGQEADDNDKEPQHNSGDEAIEMANNNNTLCAAASNGIESTNANLPNPEADKMKMEPAVEENGQSSNNGESFPIVQPITIQVKLSPLKATIPPYVQTSPYAEKIYKDANFSSFAEFEQAFEEWKQIFHHPFRVASSEKHEDLQLAQRFKYRYVVYHCSRYGEPRKRGANKRPHQNYLPCGCNAKLRLNFHTPNGGSLCVTTLYAEHNHEPISEDMKRVKNSPENELGEHSPNSTASSIAAANAGPPFSPLSLQPGLHHSPSSGGQSSSEGANNDVLGLGGILNGLISPQSHQKLPLFHHHQQNGQHYLGKPTSMTTSSRSSAVHHQSMMTTPHARTNSQSTPNGSDFLESARQHGMNDQQQQLLLPLMALFRNGNAAIRPNQSSSSFGLLSTHAQQQQQKRQQQQSTPSSSSFQNQPQNVMAGNAAVTSSMLSAALNHQLVQQIASTSSSSSSATPQTPNSSAMTLLQLQALINFFKQSKQHQQQTQSPAAAVNPNAQQLLQQFFSNVGQQQAQQQRNFQLGATGGFGHHSRESTTGGRQEIVQEADLLLQMLVDQMLRCHDLGAYLRRLRQFLTENYE